MTDIAAANLTYTINDRTRIGKKYFVEATIAFGNGALTYPSGGIPLTTAKFGFRRGIDNVTIMESSASKYFYEWDKSANTIRIFYPTKHNTSADDVMGAEFTAATTAPAATSLEVYAVGW